MLEVGNRVKWVSAPDMGGQRFVGHGTVVRFLDDPRSGAATAIVKLDTSKTEVAITTSQLQPLSEVVWFWHGGTEKGSWRKIAFVDEPLSTTLDHLKKMDFPAFIGDAEVVPVAPPETK